MLTGPATSVSLKPSDLRACIEDVPIDKDLAARQIEWIKNFVQFQTTLAFLKDPTPEYELPPVDIMGGLTDISSKAIAGAYQGEYEFERDIFELICHADDSHFGYLPYLIRGVEYTPGLAAASISLDGVALPKVYLLGKDLLDRRGDRLIGGQRISRPSTAKRLPSRHQQSARSTA